MYKRTFIVAMLSAQPILISSADAQTACKTTAECAQVAVNIAAQSKAAISILSDKLASEEAEIAKLKLRNGIVVAGSSSAGSNWSGGGSNAIDANASCPTGQVVTGLSIHLGGTCNNNCNGDGRPISTYHLVCSVLSVSP